MASITAHPCSECSICLEPLINSIVLHRATVGTGAIVGANSVVLNDTIVPPGALAVGSPAIIKEGRARSIEIELGVLTYVERGKKFRKELRKISD